MVEKSMGFRGHRPLKRGSDGFLAMLSTLSRRAIQKRRGDFYGDKVPRNGDLTSKTTDLKNNTQDLYGICVS
jgi:hypothetical protein